MLTRAPEGPAHWADQAWSAAPQLACVFAAWALWYQDPSRGWAVAMAALPLVARALTGRWPRSLAALDAALPRCVLAAAVELLRDEGAAGLTIEAVAERSGVAKTTIYRQFADREEMHLAAVQSVASQVVVPHSGDLLADVWEARPELDRNGDGTCQYVVFKGCLLYTSPRPRDS